jgi:hypothetical protein
LIIGCYACATLFLATPPAGGDKSVLCTIEKERTWGREVAKYTMQICRTHRDLVIEEQRNKLYK